MRVSSGKAVAPDSRVRGMPPERTLAYSGMVVFLGSWAMMFAALFFSCAVLRVSAPLWPPPGLPPLPLGLPGLGTLLLLSSSGLLARAGADLRRGRLRRGRRGMLGTIALGLAFMALQCKVWLDLWEGGLHLDSGAYGGTFYVLTVFHLLHVIVGLGLLARLVVPLLGRAPTAPGAVPCALTAMFWHFVDAVWLITFITVYAPWVSSGPR